VAAWPERPLAYPRLISATPAQREHDARLLGAGDPLRQDGPREGDDDDRVEESTETTLTSPRVEATAKSTAVSARSAFFRSSLIAVSDDQAQ
jgi:hypothetical protein